MGGHVGARTLDAPPSGPAVNHNVIITPHVENLFWRESSGEFRHHEWLSIITSCQRVRRVRKTVDESFPLRIEGHPGSEGGRGDAEVYTIIEEILVATIERIGEIPVRADAGANGFY